MPIVLITAAVVGGWLAWKAVKREMQRVDREMEAVRGKPAETLTRDPKTGRYTLDAAERRERQG
jgi:predicted nucleic acid-binding protein